LLNDEPFSEATEMIRPMLLAAAALVISACGTNPPPSETLSPESPVPENPEKGVQRTIDASKPEAPRASDDALSIAAYIDGLDAPTFISSCLVEREGPRGLEARLIAATFDDACATLASGSALPETHWTLEASVEVGAFDALQPAYPLGHTGTLRVCRQHGAPQLNEDGVDVNRVCYSAPAGGAIELLHYEKHAAAEMRATAPLWLEGAYVGRNIGYIKLIAPATFDAEASAKLAARSAL
jgi:hypothetical protein